MSRRAAAGLAAVVLVLAGVGIAAWVGTSSGEDASREQPPPPTATAPPRPLRIIFPEGFTRAEMDAWLDGWFSDATRSRMKETVAALTKKG